MPYFIIECSANVLEQITAEKLLSVVYETTLDSGLFTPDDMKVVIQPYTHWKLDEGKKSYVHVCGYIMEGRTKEQKDALALRVVNALMHHLPDIGIISMNIQDFLRAGYANKEKVLKTKN